ncbi:MAG: hypothetical protein ACM3Q4_03585 [Acidobacteriota bacterium]
MKKNVPSLLVCLLLLSSAAIAAGNSTSESSGHGIDWMQILFVGSYLGGVFILLPIVIYTNLTSRLFVPDADHRGQVRLLEGVGEAERNAQAERILERIGEQLTPFTSDSGERLITITKGKQAKFMKRGLDFINKRLSPTDPAVLERMKEFEGVYKDRAGRAFTGSYWIIACGAGVGALFLAGGISTFVVIHFLGLLFYILSSRTTMYDLEKRMKLFRGGAGIIGGIMTALLVGDGTKYYVKTGDGPWKRDWETEGNMAIAGLLILFFVAMVLGVLSVVLGVINFFINYSTSFLLPIGSDDKWYEEQFTRAAA